MPVLHLFFYFMFGAALFGGGGAIIQNMDPPAGVKTPQPEARSAARKQLEANALPELQQPEKAAPANPPAALPPAVEPSFDVVRIEPTGEGVIAGRAEPGWKVSIRNGDDVIETTRADKFGEWAVVLARPLPPGEYSIGLRGHSPDGTRGLVSSQQVAVSVIGGKAEKDTMVALSQPGKPTRVLRSGDRQSPAGKTGEDARTAEKSTTAPEESPGPAETAGGNAAAAQVPEQEIARAKTEKKDAGAVPQPPEAKPEPGPERGPPKSTPARPEVVISFSAVDYEAGENGAGILFLSGKAAAGARARLYIDNDRIGETVAAADGSWTFESAQTLSPDTRHTMRADAIQADGQVTSRAEVAFTPPPLPESRTRVAAKQEPPAVRPDTSSRAKPQPEVQTAAPPESRKNEAQPVADAVPQPQETQPMTKPAAADPRAGGPQAEASAPPETSKSEPEPVAQPQEPVSTARSEPDSQPASPRAEQDDQDSATTASARLEKNGEPEAGSRLPLAQKRFIVVRRGDTLWHIARRKYGRGIRYTAIYKDNRDQIRDPHWIYPGQEFSLPSN